MNVTSETDQFQVSFEPAASTRSDEIPGKFHPPSTYKFPKCKFGTLFSKSAILYYYSTTPIIVSTFFSKGAIMYVCTISLSITLNG